MQSMTREGPATIRFERAFLEFAQGQRAGGMATAEPHAEAPSPEQAEANSARSHFQPGLEVDAFAPDGTVLQLLKKSGQAMANCGAELRQAIANGPRTIGLVALHSNQGCSTTTLLLTYALAAAGEKVLVIDADENPTLANHLGVEVDRGWESALAEGRPLRDVIIRSHGDRFDFLPRLRKHARLTTRATLPVNWPDIAESYDWVLIDFGRLPAARNEVASQGMATKSAQIVQGKQVAHPAWEAFTAVCPWFVLVRRFDENDHSPQDTSCVQLPCGKLLGVIETFVPRDVIGQVNVVEKTAA